MEPNPTFYHMSTLFKIPNLKRLAMSFTPGTTGNSQDNYHLHTLQWFVDRDHGHRLFQEMEQLKLQDQTYLSLDDLITWVMLPRLKVLRVDGLEYDAERIEFQAKGSAMQLNSSLEFLILLGVSVPEDLIGSFLKHLQSLRTIIWEDRLVEIYRSRDENGDREAALREKLLSFNPRQLVYHLALNHGSTIDYLVLVTQTDAEEYIPPQNRVEIFKQFTKLTLLQFDTQLLQSKHDSNSELSPHYPSLTKILPPSIETVRINIRHGYFEMLFQLLAKIPAQRSCLPSLWQISIHFAEYGDPHETMTKITSIQGQLEAMGIQLDAIEKTKVEMGERLEISTD
jgi:hypothetical protein